MLVGILLLGCFCLSPFAGHIFNGFSYVSNRWTWAMAMLVAYIFVEVYPQMLQMNNKEMFWFLFVSIIYIVASRLTTGGDKISFLFLFCRHFLEDTMNYIWSLKICNMNFLLFRWCG